MTIFLLILAAILAIALWYILAGRRWLLTKPWAQGFFRWIDPYESALFKKSETILLGRITWLGGLLVTAYDGIATFATSLDLTPITARVMGPIPEDLRPLTVSGMVFLIGLLINWLRKRTTKPIEIVELPIDSPPNVAAAADKASAANDRAVATIQTAQDKGKV